MLLRTWFALPICGLAAAGWLCAADNQLTSKEQKTGWILLFDGQSFANWEDPARKSPPGDSFSIEDGCLKATAHPKLEEDLLTTRTWTNFELQWDWRISRRGASGLTYRVQDRVWLAGETASSFEDQVNEALRNRPTARPDHGKEYAVGFEYRMTDDGGNPDAIGNGPFRWTAALYDVFAPDRAAPLPVGKFNHSQLVVEGQRVEHWLNGHKVLEARLDSPQVASSMAKRWGDGSPAHGLLVKQARTRCPIALENHGDEAWFKNIKIRVLN
jgi:hypothetical protein